MRNKPKVDSATKMPKNKGGGSGGAKGGPKSKGAEGGEAKTKQSKGGTAVKVMIWFDGWLYGGG